MSLGENIYRLRTDKGMSQGDLADALEVSRQSVSKWETGGATPDLDKLVKLSQLFGISLDELVKGKGPVVQPGSHPAPESRVIYVERAEPAYPRRKIVGLALYGLALLVVLLCTILGSMLAGLLFSLPLWACGVICFVCKQQVGLWCGWAVFFLVDVFLHFATGYASGSFWGVLRGALQGYLNFNVAFFISLCMLLLLLILIVCTVRSYRGKVLEPSRPVTRRMIYLILGLAVLYAIPYGISALLQSYAVDGQSLYVITRIYQIMGIVMQWGRVLLFCKLLIDLFALLRWKKSNKTE